MPNSKRSAPRARKTGLIIEKLPDETLVYDIDRNVAHVLNETGALVWDLCDGKTTPVEIARALERELNARVDHKLVWLALDQLDNHHLLTDTPVPPPSFSTISRRDLVRTLGLSAAIAIPVVASIVAPFPAQAATCKADGQPCSSSLECCTPLCSTGTCGS